MKFFRGKGGTFEGFLPGPSGPPSAENLPKGRFSGRYGPLELLTRARSALDPRGAMRQATRAKLFARVAVMSPGEFLGVRKAMKTLEENKLSSRVSFAFQTVRCAHRPASA